MGGTLLTNKNHTYVTSTASVNDVKYENNRRSIYLPVVRSAVYDVFQAFDFADPSTMNGKRPSTTVAPQALFMMNSPLVLRQTRAMAEMLLNCDRRRGPSATRLLAGVQPQADRSGNQPGPRLRGPLPIGSGGSKHRRARSPHASLAGPVPRDFVVE